MWQPPQLQKPQSQQEPTLQYIIEEDSDKTRFQTKINERISAGWTLQGGVSVDWNYPPGVVAAYRQALVRIIINPIQLDIIEHVSR